MVVRRRYLSRGMYGAARLFGVLMALSTPAMVLAETRVLLVVGLGGNDHYAAEFQSEADALAERLKGVSEDVVLLSGAERGQVAEEMTSLAKRVSRDDSLVFLYVGHGSYDGEDFRFNVKGPDFTGQELNTWLGDIDAKHQLIVVTGSSSGALLDTFASPNRTLMTGTRSGDQRNATKFAQFFNGALTSDAADVNKDQRISASEAFDYAKSRVEGYYEEKNEMATEHPQTQGPAAVIVLAQLGSNEIDPEFAELVAQRESLELDIEQLKAIKSDLSSQEYFAQLQELLLKLALVEARIDLGEAVSGDGASAGEPGGRESDRGESDRGESGEGGSATTNEASAS